MHLLLLWQVTLGALLVSAASPTRTVSKRTSSKFVTAQGSEFMVGGSKIAFVGTNAYWLPALNSDEDIDATLGNISAAGIKVVRTWAFNDVTSIPQDGTWFQLVANGTTQINNGTNGLQKLDTVIKLAQKHNLFVLPSLTNNWNPSPSSSSGLTARNSGSGTTRPRNTLSNDYGGMDAYVRAFAKDAKHDEFYVNPTIINAFKDYTTHIVSRYVESPTVFAWELANDPRCNSSIAASPDCTTTTVTRWHSILAQHIASIDPNHLITSGNQGFFCVECPKLFPRIVPPPPQVSPGPSRRRSNPKPLTKRGLIEQRKMAMKRTRNLNKREPSAGGVRIRGRWTSTETRRQFDQGVGSGFDGSQGVDSEDIINIPQIGFGTFQLFPDQNKYGVDDPNLSGFDNTVAQGNTWIQSHADMGQLFNKPVTLNGFGLVTQNNAPDFVPFSSTVAPFAPDATNPQGATQQQPFVTDDQRDSAYTQWLQTGLQSGVQGMTQYQWSQSGLTPAAGTVVPTVSGTGTTPTVGGTGLSPNDGYSLQGSGQSQAVSVIQSAAQQFGSG